MAHNAFRKSPAGSWAGVTAVLPGDFTFFDQTLFKCINGDDGGTWAPATPLEVGGSGLLLSGALHEIQAGTVFRVKSAGVIEVVGAINVDTDGGIRYINSNPALDFKESFSAAELYLADPAVDDTTSDPKLYFTTSGGLVIDTTTGGTDEARFRLPARNGCLLKGVTMRYIPATGHSGLPANFPKFRVDRVSVTDASSTPSSLFTGGYVVYSAGSLGAWNAGTIQATTLVPNTNATPDRSAFFYFISFREEHGLNALPGIVLSFTLNWKVEYVTPY